MPHDERLAERIRELLATEGDVTERRMFGGLAFMLSGHLTVAASGQGGLLVRVDPEESEALLASTEATPMEMAGRQVAGWVRVRGDAVESDAELGRWVRDAVGYVRTLPPKQRPA